MSLTKVSYSMISGAPTNVMDYITLGTVTATTDCTTFFTNALAVNGSIYVPNGTYILNELPLNTGNQIIGQSKTGVVFKGAASATKILKTNNSTANYSTDPIVFVTNLRLDNFTLDMSAMTDSSSVSGIYLTASYLNSISNISYISADVFPVSANGLNIDGFVYNTSIYDCYFPFVRAVGKAPVGSINGYSTTIDFYQLNSYGIQLAYINSTNFFAPILQKEYDKFVMGTGTSFITIIGGDIEQGAQHYFLKGNGNFISNITTFNNTFVGFIGGFKDSSTNWASCNFSDEYTLYGPRPVTGVTRSTTTATATTSINHMLNTGDKVDISGFTNSNFNGSYVVTVTGATTFTYIVSNTGATSETASALVTPDWQGNGAAWYPLGLNFYRNVSGSRWVSDNIYNTGYLYLGSQTAISDNRALVLAAGNSKIGFEHQTPSDNYYPAFFYNASGTSVGNISCSSTATTYNTTSDQRLKTDLGVVTSTDIISKTVIHDFTWPDNTKSRGVFAQEAYLVKPDAVHVGSDEKNLQGNLVQPWGVDYSKYVPDLIVELQALRKEFEAYKASHP